MDVKDTLPYFIYAFEQMGNVGTDYGTDPVSIDFGHHNIHVITDEHGIELPDIVSEIDNKRLLEKCLKLSFRFTRDPDCALFFSVAGGRKIMGSCLTMAVQIYGRPQDRLFHLLVSPEFFLSAEDPFYKKIRFADVNLIPIPFFSIRDRITPAFLEQPCDPGTLMLYLIKEGTQTATSDTQSRNLQGNKIEIRY